MVTCPLRYVTLPVVGLLLVGLGFGLGISQTPAVAIEPDGAADIDEMVEDCQRHMAAMAPMMEDMGDMMQTMGAMGQMMDAPGMRRMMDAPGMDRMMEAPGMDRMMRGMRP